MKAPAQRYHEAPDASDIADADASRMRAERIKAEIRIRAGSLAAFAARHSYDRSAISIALSTPWPAVERLIADLLETQPWELWPERYTADHAPRSRIELLRVAGRRSAR